MEKEFLTIREITALAKQAGQKSDTMKEWRMQARRRGWKTMGPGVYRVVDGEPVYHVSVLGERLRKLVRPPKPDAEAMKIRRAQDHHTRPGRLPSARPQGRALGLCQE